MKLFTIIDLWYYNFSPCILNAIFEAFPLLYVNIIDG